MFTQEEIIQLIIVFLAVVVSVVLHEVAHGVVAFLFGDNTAYKKGRLSLNPIIHIDIWGSIIMPLFMYLSFGAMLAYAKPVPVNFNNLRCKRLASILVAIAGPMTNVALALISIFIIKNLNVYYMVLMGGFKFGLLCSFLENMIWLNIMLAVFNMIPILPLDGGRVLENLLPKTLAKQYAKSERFGMMILLFIILILPYIGQLLDLDLNVYYHFITKARDLFV